MSKEVVKKSAEERFATSIANQYKSIGGFDAGLSDAQLLTAKKYFIGIDRALRRAQSTKKANAPDINWNSVNLETLGEDMVDNILAGLDPTSPNHINFIPFIDRKTGQYNLNQILGYVGLEVRHANQGLHPIKNLITRLVYSNESFEPIFSNGETKDSFIHKASENPFDKGEVVGGYIYKEYEDGRTSLQVVTLNDIMKRKPKHASVEFWGGEKTVWEGGRPSDKTEKVEGWADEMMQKTLIRMAYNSEPLDPRKTAPRVNTFESNEDITDEHFSDYTVVPEAIGIEKPKIKEVEKPKAKEPKTKVTELPLNQESYEAPF